MIAYIWLAFFSFFVYGSPMNVNLEKATFGGGCFWCMESPFESLDGVKSVISGYSGGTVQNPTYKQVSQGTTGHVEVVQITYDANKVPYQKLLEIYWRNINPTQKDGQFNDHGSQYRTVIFYHNNQQKQLAQESKNSLEASKVFDKPIVTEITAFTSFFPAEDYHQDYYKKNSLKYKFYRRMSGRDQFITKTWSREGSQCSQASSSKKEVSFGGVCEAPDSQVTKNKSSSSNVKDFDYFKNFKKPSDGDLKKQLGSLQFNVTQKDDTERSFNNPYWDNKEEGIYVDVVSGEPLFSSKDKYDSGTGWPSFTRPIDSRFIKTQADRTLSRERTEVRSQFGDSHLGHVFKDGPPSKGGLRYCINSASVRFIPKNQLEQEGYSQWAQLFQ